MPRKGDIKTGITDASFKPGWQFGDCVIWQGPRSGSLRYGAYRSTTNGKRYSVQAHRHIWMIFHGPIPGGLLVRHKCDDPLCVNILHLELGTQIDNMRDMVERGRAHHPLGELNSHAKLTVEATLTVRKMAAEGFFQKDIGKKFGISQGAVSKIVTGRNWKHVK